MNTELKQKDWDSLIALLREEVSEYGGLYNLLERQQEQIFNREPELVISTNEEIEAYMAEMGGLREKREARVRELAQQYAGDEEISLSALLPLFPDYAQPLLQALTEEVNHMVEKTRRKARQNFLLLSRTMELTHETISALQPENFGKTYSRKGQVGMKGKLPSRYNTFV